jgi:hypothetical protein
MNPTFSDYTHDISNQRALLEAELNDQLPPGVSCGKVTCEIKMDPYGDRETVLARYRDAVYALKEMCRQHSHSTPIVVSIQQVGFVICLVAQFQ